VFPCQACDGMLCNGGVQRSAHTQPRESTLCAVCRSLATLSLEFLGVTVIPCGPGSHHPYFPKRKVSVVGRLSARGINGERRPSHRGAALPMPSLTEVDEFKFLGVTVIPCGPGSPSVFPEKEGFGGTVRGWANLHRRDLPGGHPSTALAEQGRWVGRTRSALGGRPDGWVGGWVNAQPLKGSSCALVVRGLCPLCGWEPGAVRAGRHRIG
jgi:hypothetical protein